MVVETDECVLFWSGWPSQHAPATFEVCGVWYNCTQQYLMAERARMFGDADRLDDIMWSRDPVQQTVLGHAVKNCDEARWRRAVPAMLLRGNMAKYAQNATLKRLLLATHPKVLVQASPYDTVYGVGLTPHDPRALDPEHWRGLNLLGTALMQTRQTLLGAVIDDAMAL